MWVEIGKPYRKIKEDAIKLAHHYFETQIYLPAYTALAACHLLAYKKHYAWRVWGIFKLAQLKPADVEIAVRFFSDKVPIVAHRNVELPSDGDLDQLRRTLTPV